MIRVQSIKTRFLSTVGANIIRSGVSFLCGLLIARQLGPGNYGDLMFLLTSFVSVRNFFDMGSSNAFFTFVSQVPRSKRFYRAYGGWLLVQFSVILVILIFFQEGYLQKIWLQQPRFFIIAAFLASFFQQNMWNTINQIAESARETVRIQIVSVGIIVLQLAAILLLIKLEKLSVITILFLYAIEYFIATIVGVFLFRKLIFSDRKDTFSGTKEVILAFANYCRPLCLLGVLSFFYGLADKWLLQYFGGSREQGFLQLSSQFANISLLATTAILNVLWKEVAEAVHRGELERLQRLYNKVSRGLYGISAMLSAMIVPWSKEILNYTVGVEYEGAAITMALMFLCQVHLCLGQVTGTLLLASGQTKRYMQLSAIFMFLTIPITYIVQAPVEQYGLALGAKGMALQMLAINIVSVMTTLWMVAKRYKWKCEWKYQLSIVFFLLESFIAKELTGLLHLQVFYIDFFLSALLYGGAVILTVLLYPASVGLEYSQIKYWTRKFAR